MQFTQGVGFEAMFGFAKTPKEPLSDARSAQRWLASFAATDPLAAHGALLQELSRAAEPNPHRKPGELEALFVADAYARDMRRVLCAQYIEHASRSGKIEHQLWQALFDLTQAFLVAYGTFERDALVQDADERWHALLPELIAREMLHLGCDAKLRMFRYEPWIPAKWADLHQRFTLACTRKIERERLMLRGESNPVTIEHIYIVALVLQLANAGNLSRAQIDWLATQFDDWCSSLRLSVTSPGPTAFYVDVAQRVGLRRRTAAPLESQVLFLDTEPLHAILQHYILATEQKVRQQPLSPKTARRVERLTLLSKVAAQVDVQFRPVERRGERTVAVGKVDALVGLKNICGCLREEESPSAAEADSVTTYSGTLDIALFGHLRNEHERRKELQKKRFAAFSTPGGPWEMKDVSATGMRLTAPMEAATTVTLGMLVALRMHGDLVWTLGVVRRMRRVTAERAEIGLQRIADTINVVDIATQRPTADGDYTVDGESSRQKRFRGLFLVLRQGNRAATVQSLVFPAAEYAPGKRYGMTTSSTSYSLRCGTLLEQEPDWVWVSLDPGSFATTRAETASAPGD